MHCILRYPSNVFPDQTAADAALYRTCRRTCIVCTGRGCILNILRGFGFNTRRFVHNVVSTLQMCDDIGRTMESHASIAQLAEHCVLGHLLAEIPNVAGTFTLFFVRWRICSPLHVFWNKFCLHITMWYELMDIKMDREPSHLPLHLFSPHACVEDVLLYWKYCRRRNIKPFCRDGKVLACRQVWCRSSRQYCDLVDPSSRRPRGASSVKENTKLFI